MDQSKNRDPWRLSRMGNNIKFFAHISFNKPSE